MIVSKIFDEKFADKIEQNVLLRDFTSIGVGGVADYFLRIQRIDDLVLAISELSRAEIPYFVLGGGYNIVVSDLGFPGFVIKNEVRDIVFSQTSAEVIVSSGVEISRLLMDAASRDLGGLEFLYGIPGTVGGSVYGNAGAFGHSIGDFIKSATLIFPGNKNKEAKIFRKTKKWFEFGNRTSKIKEISKLRPDENKPVLLSVKLQLCQSRKEVIVQKMQENFKYKKEKQPLLEKSAGCFFKNPGNSPEQSAGLLLDRCKAKRKRIKDACVSKKHANFIINKNRATAEDIRRLANELKEMVRAEYRTNLEEEIEYIGRW